MDAIAPNNVWAVGYYSTSNDQALVVHLDGSGWSAVPAPVLAFPNTLSGVVAVAPGDIWAVGSLTESGGAHSLVEHWDGTAWSVVSTPDVGGLSGVEAVGATDIWVVGGSAFLHWDGTAWATVADPAGGHLLGIDVLSATDIWAVGSRSVGGVDRTLVERYLSSCITATPTLSPTGTPTYAPFCQVVIHGSITSTDPAQTGILNFVHTPSLCQWTPRACPGVADTLPRHYKAYTFWNPVGSFSTQCINIRVDTSDCSGNIFSASYVTSFSPDNICDNYLGDTGDVVVDHGSYEFNIFRGRYVVVVVAEVTPNSGCSNFTVTITPQYQCFTTATPTHQPTATYTAGTATHTPTGAPTNTPTRTPTNASATQTVAGATSTRQSWTSTPTSSATTGVTPTFCSVAFNDVLPGSTSYPFVRCLACLGIVQGYLDGTFKPNNNVTRGQAAKIMSGSAGYIDGIPPGQQTFRDVPPGSIFWLYTERVALHGAINGYPCGNPGEPCPGRYFRPQNSMTRGQVAKVASIAAGYADPIPPGQQSFGDVPSGSTFWLYVERVTLHGVVNGYPDGTYRPNNQVTRGQLAKIAANTFFPSCGQ